MNNSFISNIESGLQYSSKISYSFYLNNILIKKETHNTGCDYLFQLFAKALAGEDTRNMKPVLVDLKANNGLTVSDPTALSESAVSTWPSVLANKITLTGRQYAYINGTGWSTVVTITIPWTAALASNISSYNNEFALCLYSQDGNMLAYFLIDNDTITSFTQSGSGSTILVEWIMTVMNS